MNLIKLFPEPAITELIAYAPDPDEHETLIRGKILFNSVAKEPLLITREDILHLISVIDSLRDIIDFG